jgi:hypothetical protein
MCLRLARPRVTTLPTLAMDHSVDLHQVTGCWVQWSFTGADARHLAHEAAAHHVIRGMLSHAGLGVRLVVVLGVQDQIDEVGSFWVVKACRVRSHYAMSPAIVNSHVHSSPQRLNLPVTGPCFDSNSIMLPSINLVACVPLGQRLT